MAISTAGIYLYAGNASGEPPLEKLVDIIDFPDMGATPSKIDTTTLSALKFKTSILGLQEIPDLTFTANYDKATYAKLDKMKDQLSFELRFGESAENGKLAWKGKMQVYVNGAGVDEAVKMTLTLSAETEITFSEGA